MTLHRMAAAAAATLVLAACGQSGSDGGLTGATRTAFVTSAVGSCSQKVQSDPSNASLSPAVVTQYCTCYSNKMADTISPAELQTLNDTMQSDPAKAQSMMQPRIDAAVSTCKAQIGR